tara:strand:- start:438 stop:710 length:273 start_codon:yes stop_codon:yes gene_type:complete
MSSDYPPREWVEAAELLMTKHKEGVVIYESDKGPMLVVVTDLRSKEVMKVMIDSLETFQSIMSPDTVVLDEDDEEIPSALLREDTEVPEA